MVDLIGLFLLINLLSPARLFRFWLFERRCQTTRNLSRQWFRDFPRCLVQVKATVLRDGQAQEIPNEKVVPGDIVVHRHF